MLFHHFIITRFNIRLFKKRNNGEVIKSNDVDFLSHRFELFEKYCVPSIKNQSNQNFKWLVIMDIDTPQQFKDRLSKLHSEYDNLIPCYLDVDKYDIDFSKEEIEQYNNYAHKTHIEDYAHISYGTKLQLLILPRFIKDMMYKCNSDIPEYYITTRIDNDDAFHCDMVKTIQQQFLKDKEHCMYNYLYGYQYILNKNIAQKYFYERNHFTSLVEKSDSLFQSVFYWDHRFVDMFIPLRNIKTKPLWTELLHNNNVGNAFVINYKNSLLTGSMLFKPKDFGYKDMETSILNAIKFVLTPFNMRAFLRSIKKKLMNQE